VAILKSSQPGMPGFVMVAAMTLGFAAFAMFSATRWTVYRPVGLPHAPANESWPDMRIDVNAAGAGELNLLPGIGPALAEAIVADRESHGVYATIEAMDRVRNIGPKRIEAMLPYAVVAPSNSPAAPR
jgi:competence protein ComEA